MKSVYFKQICEEVWDKFGKGSIRTDMSQEMAREEQQTFELIKTK